MKVHDFSNVLHEPALSDSDLRSLETEIKLMNEEVARLAEKRMEKTRCALISLQPDRQDPTRWHCLDSKLPLFHVKRKEQRKDIMLCKTR